MSRTDTGVKIKRYRVPLTVPVFGWRALVSLVFGGGAFYFVVPWALTQRGYAAVGGEYLLVLAVVILPYCIFRSR